MNKFKIIGILPVFNEADILSQTIAYTTKQGIPLVIVDNGSTDGSLAIERRFLRKGVLEVREVHPNPYYDIKEVLGEAYETALSYSPDWLFHLNADEFIESPYPGLNLAKAIQNEAEFGYNMIQVNIFDFQLTERDYQSKIRDVRKRLRYYSWISDFHYRAWKNYPGTDLLVHAGHKPVFPPGVEEKISPLKFALRHYKFRSVEHGLSKVFKDRLPRYDPKNRALGWHVQYNAFKPDPRYFVVDSLKLSRYDEDGRWNLERVFDPYYGGWAIPNVQDHLPTRELVKGLNQKIEAISCELDALKAFYLRTDPISALLSSYYERGDLQEAFPEVRNGEYSRLIKWASCAPDDDCSSKRLAPYRTWYKRKLKEKKRKILNLFDRA